LISDDAEELRLQVGDVILLPRGTGHALGSDPAVALIDLEYGADAAQDPVVFGPDGDAEPGQPARLLCGGYQFDPVGRRHPLLQRLPAVIHIPADLGVRTRLTTITELLAHELAGVAPGRDLAVESLLDFLLVSTLREWLDRHPEQGWSTALTDPPIASALKCLHAQPAAPWTVAKLADTVGLSRAVFARRFTDLVGQAPLGYLTWWRMNLAAQLLRDEHRGLTEIARSVGYTSPYAFSNAFKRHHGVAPTTFRHAGSTDRR
jgi:AraC-like DNA-binding protein